MKKSTKKSTHPKKWINCDLEIKNVSKNIWDIVSNVKKNVIMKLQSNPVTYFQVAST